ncbi:DUF5691 domain-containing protein [Streptomyces sp. NPDC007088]|uniref:DUF5691 domain-containing protein n=1 Tax=Streptomyces sp. NPDC007088 TaxID=3364773 RepID=UPI0036BBFF0A
MSPAHSPAPEVEALSWEHLVTTALLGTDRRPLPASGTAADGPAALLDAAALHTVRRRAGVCPAPAAPPLEVSDPDTRPPLPAAARRRLALLLADRGGGGGGRGSAPDLTELLPQWLALAGSLGFAAPAELLPALLDAARARTDLRPAALAFAGPRARWLARLNPDWKYVLRTAVDGDPALPPGERGAAVRRLWEEGLFAERVALLGRLRTEDPAAALDLLAGTWRTERAEDRLMFVDSLRTGLSPADEPFLEQALADRSRNVRALAAELLSALPESALAGRMARRAATCVAPDRITGPGPGIAVEAPHACDAAMERDGVVAKPPSGRGERSWWLGQIVEAAPLSTWTERFGGASPAGIVAMPVADGWQGELHAAWCRAAVRQGDVAWSRALLGAPGSPQAAGPGAVSLAERARLLAALPDEERAEWVALFVAAHGLSEAFQLLGGCAVPWHGALGRAVVDALNIARDSGSYPWSFSGVMGLAERCLDPAEADRLESLAAATAEPPDTRPGSGAYWVEAFQRLVSTLRLRDEMRRELEGREGAAEAVPRPRP